MVSAVVWFLPAMMIVALPCVDFPKAWPIPEVPPMKRATGKVGRSSTVREWHGLPAGKPRVFSYRLVALVTLKILQFFSCKSVKNWPSYILCKFEPHSFTDEPMAPHLVAAGMPNLENVQIRLIGTVDVAAAASKLGHWGSNLVEL